MASPLTWFLPFSVQLGNQVLPGIHTHVAHKPRQAIERKRLLFET